MEFKGKACPVALSLLVSTSSEAPSTASSSGTEEGICHGKGSVAFGNICVWILGKSGCRDAGVVQLELSLGEWVSPWGCGTAQVSQGTTGRACVVFTLSQLHLSPQDSSSTTIFIGPSGSPHSTPLLKQRFQRRRPNKSFSAQQNPPQAGMQGMKFPLYLQMGTQPLIPTSDLHRMWGVLKSQKQLYFFSPCCSG